MLEARFGTEEQFGPFNGTSESGSIEETEHEIRSAIQGLLGYLDIFTDEVRRKLDLDLVHLLERINYFANNLSDLITEYLAAAR